MSPQKLLDIGVLGSAQAFISPTKNNITLTHHHDLAVDQTKPLTLALKNHNLWIANQSSGNAHASSHAAGKLNRHFIDRILKVHKPQHTSYFGLDFCFRYTLLV